ncbi:flagellar hook-basal body complex protein FliE [Ethanoligenens harbinense YUAN-3]|uniref:Flagellar hook-basal body complex protein FliE n=1 Tax=Ethanoligenens harbinense (strain DSM 18485 / JCM 12961 / CGMCC 1.5033 / YUAN-3) TaxID=663278 RepID=E6U6K3_ETHHY|nr:flagellar hook-basal body complex protein FliE [Ethanoligenens harbinense YUAN-3]
MPQIASLSQTGLSTAQTASGTTVDGTQMFGDIYNQLVDGVNQTDSAFQADIVKAAAGEMDNPAQLLIDSSKAQVALQLASSVRNNALQAYNTVMNMQV